MPKANNTADTYNILTTRSWRRLPKYKNASAFTTAMLSLGPSFGIGGSNRPEMKKTNAASTPRRPAQAIAVPSMPSHLVRNQSAAQYTGISATSNHPVMSGRPALWIRTNGSVETELTRKPAAPHRNTELPFSEKVGPNQSRKPSGAKVTITSTIGKTAIKTYFKPRASNILE